MFDDIGQNKWSNVQHLQFGRYCDCLNRVQASTAQGIWHFADCHFTVILLYMSLFLLYGGRREGGGGLDSNPFYRFHHWY